MRNILVALTLLAGCVDAVEPDHVDAGHDASVMEKWAIDLELTEKPTQGCADWPRLQILVYDPCTDPVLVGDEGPVDVFTCETGPSCKSVACERRITEDLSLWLTVSPTWAVADYNLCRYGFGQVP